MAYLVFPRGLVGWATFLGWLVILHRRRQAQQGTEGSRGVHSGQTPFQYAGEGHGRGMREVLSNATAKAKAFINEIEWSLVWFGFWEWSA